MPWKAIPNAELCNWAAAHIHLVGVSPTTTTTANSDSNSRSLVGEHEQHTDQGESSQHGENLGHAVVGIGELREENLEKSDVQERAARYSLEGAVGNVPPNTLKNINTLKSGAIA